LTLDITEAHAGRRLDAVLGGWLPEALGRPLSKSAVRKLIVGGAIRLHGRPLRQAGRPLPPGSRIEAEIDLERLDGRPASRDEPFTLTDESILYEDDSLIAVDKPPGLPAHAAADPERDHLDGAVRRFLAVRGGSSYLGVHQRLDCDTSGVVLFAKRPEANAGLARLFAGRLVVKTYHALTARPRRKPPRAWRSAARLGPAGRGGVAVAPGGMAAETDFRCLEVLARGLLIEARPRTGRKHQVRVHLAAAGLPILGDALYGGATRLGALAVARTMLHAVRLRLPHPLSGRPLTIESAYPEDFERALLALRRG
jgi:23S rRNA pseudouridine1911/1915/1917 synthase